jgi:dGTPase
MASISPQRDDRLHEDRPADQRTAGQRDRDRILYASALRRLAGVTQVVAPTEGLIFHNRLTHTLKVGQIGRRLAEKLCEEQPQLLNAVGGLDPEVVEAAALAHDLGHPPFGHVVEDELNQLVSESGVYDGFEGNAQSFRVIAKLARRHESFEGLNLTRATLNAVLKYPWFRTPDKKKWGAYYTESTEFNWARQLYPGDAHKSAEAELMDWADDVAYSVHDVEDFYRAGLIPVDRMITDTHERIRSSQH